MRIGDNLKELRHNHNLTQEQVAAGLGITKSSWSMYERNERIPRDEVKVKIAVYFNTSVENLFFNNFEHK